MTGILRVAENVVAESAGEDLCLMRLDTAAVLVLNRTAADVWLLATDGLAHRQIVEALSTAYRHADPNLDDQVGSTIAALVDQGFLVEALGA